MAILAVASVSLGILISGHDAEKSDVTSEAKAEAFQNALNAYKIYLNNYSEIENFAKRIYLHGAMLAAPCRCNRLVIRQCHG